MKVLFILIVFTAFSITVTAQKPEKVVDRPQQKVIIYPNPAHDELNFSGIQPGDIISLLDSTGKELMHHSAANPDFQWKVGHLSKGTYLLKIVTKNGLEGSSELEKD